MIIPIKSLDELPKWKEAGNIAASILKELINNADESVSTFDLNELAVTLINEYRAESAFYEYKGFPAHICTSVNNKIVHGLPNKTKLKNGDVLSIDIGINYNGYIGDTAETIVIGSNDSELIKCCRHALHSAIKIAMPGNNLLDITKIIESVAKDNDLVIPYEYGGHGLSVNMLHDEPFVANNIEEGVDVILRQGMVLAIEPMFIEKPSTKYTKVSTDGWAVVADNISSHCEHTIFITDSNPIILTER